MLLPLIIGNMCAKFDKNTLPIMTLTFDHEKSKRFIVDNTCTKFD